MILGALCTLLSGEEVKRLTIEQWEGIVKRATDTLKDDGSYNDDAAHIVDVQQYYRRIFAEGWDEPGQEQSINAVSALVAYSNLRKKIPERYIVMFDEAVDTNEVLDRTIDNLQQVHWISNQHVRAADFFSFRHVRKGFIATLNSRAVELVSGLIITLL